VLLALAASGVYAIMAFAVAQRTREIGIRTALGARAIDIAKTIGRRAAVQIGIGAAAGMPIAGVVYFRIRAEPTATVEAFLVGIVPGLFVVLLVGLAACTGPLRRALRISPNLAIRETG
jgi:ABC-type antimicrobial peptide transport system permease subunit